jgi:hypothetical protein
MLAEPHEGALAELALDLLLRDLQDLVDLIALHEPLSL